MGARQMDTCLLVDPMGIEPGQGEGPLVWEVYKVRLLLLVALGLPFKKAAIASIHMRRCSQAHFRLFLIRASSFACTVPTPT